VPAIGSSASLYRRRVLAVALGVGCALALGACGSSKGSASGSSDQSSGLRFAECMRSHGVPNFPDPPAGGGPLKIVSGSGIDPQSPAFQSAQSACFKLLPGKAGPGGSSESRKLQLLTLARCMRAHGVTSFPDPTPGAPTAPPSGGGIAFGGPGGFISVPQTLIQSPAFKQAAATCRFPGFGSGGGQKARL
jgi:hypothetical protein